jgi:mono/diheme cytochrome c family protein
MKTILIIALGVLATLPLSTRAADPKTLWESNCVQCHGKTGAADTKMGKILNAKNLTDPKVQASFTDAEAADAIKNGKKENGRMVMKAFGSKLNDADVNALVKYVRSLKK